MRGDERFWARTLWRDDAPDACLIWCGALNCHGYGRVRFQGRFWAAHRLAYELTYGPIPEGLTLRRTCGEPACVRPEHLELSRPYRKLTVEQVRAIRRALGSLGQVARQYGVGRTQIYYIKTGRARTADIRDLCEHASL